jgi:hypothetical protein
MNREELEDHIDCILVIQFIKFLKKRKILFLKK